MTDEKKPSYSEELVTRRGALALICGLASQCIAMGSSGYNARPVTISDNRSKKQVRLQLISKFGTINVHSRHDLSRLLNFDPKGGRPALLHPRLLLMLQRIGDSFPRKRIEVLSAYRLEGHGEGSNHGLGRAIDFRVLGVPLQEVWDFVTTLPKCGLGYYPESDFIHLDVRDEFAMWIDHHHKGKNCAISAASDVAVPQINPERELEFYGVSANRTLKLEIVSEKGVVNNRSRVLLSELAAYKVKNTRIALFHPRLILMLQKVAEKYPGRRFEVISGYRLGKTRHSSPHNYGRAMDFRMEGISKKELYEFMRSFPKCGTGYYPNSVFVHLDVRDRKATWVDNSGVGE